MSPKDGSATTGDLFIVSAPSGAGKSTILRSLFAQMEGLSFSVSHTTRPMRAGEVEGKDYFFVSRQEFREMVSRGAFLEWAEVHGNLYGTSRSNVEQQLRQGTDLILDVDVQGAAQVKARFPEAVTVFVVPPSMEVLEERLRKRGTEDEATLQLRLDNAAREMRSAGFYDYIIVNDLLDRAVEEMRTIIAARRLSARRRISAVSLG